MLGFGATGQFAIGQVGAATAETILADKWFVRLSEPVRFLPGLAASQQRFSAFPDPFPFVSFGWFEELSIPPKRTLPGLPPSQQQFIAWQPAPSPFVATGWFEALSEPVRFLPGLKPSQQQFGTHDTQVIPVSLMAWDVALSEPVRFKIGLRAPQQQFEARPSQLRPNPTITGILNALETKDVFLAGILEWNKVTSGEIGINLANSPGAEIGVTGPTITSAQISIRMV